MSRLKSGILLVCIFSTALLLTLPSRAENPEKPQSVPLWDVADLLFRLKYYAEAESVYKAAGEAWGERAMEAHKAYWLAQRTSMGRVMCLEYMGKWSEAARLYIGIANNYQGGATHFSREERADYRLVALYAAAGQLDDLIAITKDLDARLTESFRLFDCQDEKQFREIQSEGCIPLEYEPVRKVIAQWGKSELPNEVRDFFAQLPVIPQNIRLPREVAVRDGANRCYTIDVQGGQFQIPALTVLKECRADYNADASQENRELYKRAFAFYYTGGYGGKMRADDREIPTFIPLLLDESARFKCSKGAEPIPVSTMKHSRDPEDLLGTNRFRCPCGDEILLYDKGGRRPPPANAGALPPLPLNTEH